MAANCPGIAPPATADLQESEMRALLEDASAALIDRLQRPSPVTVSTLSRQTIEAHLPARAPRRGGGANRLRRILHDEFLPFTRDYRHPLHLGHQRPAPSFASLYADFVAAAFNPTVTMFEGGPYAVAVEGRVLQWMKDLTGYPANAVATMVNGGAEANLTALMVARDAALARGVALCRQRILVGEHAHYSIARSLHVLGLPPSALVMIASRGDLSMDPAALAEVCDGISMRGHLPVAIVAAAGCTANGAFDDLVSLRRIADSAGAWLHVDAAHGGAALLSSRFQALAAGTDSADSIVINPHKMFFVSSPCSVLLSRRRAEFAASLAVGLAGADYVLPDPAALDLQGDGDEPLRWTLACTRFFSAFRLYAAISAYGLDGLASRVERCCDLAAALARIVEGEADFEILMAPAFNMLCFRYRPPGQSPAALDALNRALRQRLAAGPEAYLTGCSIRGVYWLRAQIMSEQVSENSLANLPDILRATAAPLTAFQDQGRS